MTDLQILIICAAIVLFPLTLFLVLREIIMWYWKINERIDLMNSMLSELKSINEKLENKKTTETSRV